MIQATAKVLDDMDCYLPDDNSVRRIARFFATLSDPSRVKLLSALTISPLCVTDIAAILNMNHRVASTATSARPRYGDVRTAGQDTQIQDRQSQNKRNTACGSGISRLLIIFLTPYTHFISNITFLR